MSGVRLAASGPVDRPAAPLAAEVHAADCGQLIGLPDLACVSSRTPRVGLGVAIELLVRPWSSKPSYSQICLDSQP